MKKIKIKKISFKDLHIYVILNILSFFELTIYKGTWGIVITDEIQIGVFDITTSENKEKWLSQQNCPYLKDFFSFTSTKGFKVKFKLNLLDIYGKWRSNKCIKTYWIYNTIKIIIIREVPCLTKSIFEEDIKMFESFYKPLRNVKVEYHIYYKSNDKEMLHKVLDKNLLVKHFKSYKIIEKYPFQINVLVLKNFC